MFNHEPKDYLCPFCNFLAGNETEYNTKQDIVYQNELVTAFVAPRWWQNNEGHVVVISNKHYENLYDISDDVLTEAYIAVKRVAVAIRSTYGCGGTSTRQHNEPIGGQEIWHFHAHVFPRYENDRFYEDSHLNRFVGPEERLPYARKLQAYFVEHPE